MHCLIFTGQTHTKQNKMKQIEEFDLKEGKNWSDPQKDNS